MAFLKIPAYAIVETTDSNFSFIIPVIHRVINTRSAKVYKTYYGDKLDEAKAHATRLTARYQLLRAKWEIWVYDESSDAWEYIETAKNPFYAEHSIVKYDKELVAIVHTPDNRIVNLSLHGTNWIPKTDI